MNNPPLTIAQLQATVHHWITTTGHGYHSPLTNGLILAEETGETARILARLHGDQRPKPTDDITPDHLADELADLLWVIAALANQTGIDLTQAIARNIHKKNTRDANRFSQTK